MFKKTLCMLVLCAPVFAAPQGSQASTASTDLSSLGMSEIVSGSGHVLTAGSQLIVVAIERAGDFTLITLRAAGQSAQTTIRVSTHVAGHLLTGAGQLVQVMGTGAGILLYHSGQVLAFIPNEMGKSLIYSHAFQVEPAL